MFVITFIISIKTVFNKKKTQSEVNETIQDNNIEKNETGTTETATSHKENVLYDSIEQEENTIQENVIEQNIITENINNYYKIGILSLSAIFLFFTIFFTIIIIKYQSKRKKHLYNKKD